MSTISDHILTVDDDEDFNNILKLMLKKMGHKAITTTTPVEFISELKNQTPKLAIIDLNLDIAFGAGFQLIEAIRNSIGYKLPLIVISKRTDREDIARALELGANDFVPKPLDSMILENKVEQLLSSGEYRNPLPLYLVSEKDWPCKFNLGLNLHSINEFGLTLKGNHFLTKGTPLHLSGNKIEEIFSTTRPVYLTVNNSWINEETKEFFSFLEFDFENKSFLTSIRRWILRNTSTFKDEES